MLSFATCSVCLVLLSHLSALHMSNKKSRTRAEELETKNRPGRCVEKDCRLTQSPQAPREVLLGSLAYVCVSGPRVSRCTSPIGLLERRAFLVLTEDGGWSQTWRAAGNTKLRWLVPALSPVGAHCSFYSHFDLFSLVLATDLSQSGKENWLLVSFLRNFSHSPPFPGFHISLFNQGLPKSSLPFSFLFEICSY